MRRSASPSRRSVSAANEKLDKLDLSIFDTGDEFDAVSWMNDIFSKHNVDYEKLESWYAFNLFNVFPILTLHNILSL